MDYDIVVVHEGPFALCSAFHAERPLIVLPEPILYGRRYGLDLPFRLGAADEQIVRYGRELLDIEYYYLLRFLVEGQLGDLERLLLGFQSLRLLLNYLYSPCVSIIFITLSGRRYLIDSPFLTLLLIDDEEMSSRVVSR